MDRRLSMSPQWTRQNGNVVASSQLLIAKTWGFKVHKGILS